MSGLPRAGSTTCSAIRLPSGDSRGQFCGRRSDSRTPVPSRATVPSRTPYGIGIATVASRSADALSIAEWYGVFAPAATGNVRGSPTSLSAAASKGRACNWPSAAESSTPRSRPDVGTNTASDSDRKSGEPGLDAGRSMRATYTPRRSSVLALTWKRKWMPSGRKTGHRCEFSPRSKSTSVAGCTGPPSADTLASPSKIMLGPNTIVPVGLHAPPFPSGASQMTTGTPPATATFISLPRAKNPSDVPSGDQNGCFAPSVPAMAVASRESSDRTNRRGANRR